jgi:hypothetical protein
MSASPCTSCSNGYHPPSAPHSSSTTLLSLPTDQEAGVVAVRRGRAVSFLALSVRHGRIHHFDSIVDPVKLGPITAALGL